VEQLNNIDNGLLWKALANPANALAGDAAGIETLVNNYPQSGLLKALLAADGNEQNVNHAAAYFDPAALYKLVNMPESLAVVSPGQVIWTDSSNTEVENEETFVEYLSDNDTAAHPEVAPIDKAEYFHQDIEDDVYDEIVSIEDITLEQLTSAAHHEPESNTAEEEDTHIPANVHFVIDKAFTQPQPDTGSENAVVVKPKSIHIENQELSRYNDEKMPYSFMWWLDKTRKEYAGTYQPYASNSDLAQTQVQNQNGVDELQQQYVESIFNLNAIEELERSTVKKEIEFNIDKKEDRIIKRFIQTEPQIKHPTGIGLDNENKAKKSSEDADEIVTETLARIYTEQMLYPKAINVYKKLMLKFPEKSLYFASQIEQIEKKSN
jgi:hypothetical protein